MEPKILGGTRNSMFGDIVLSSIFSTYLKKIWPNSFINTYIDKKCSQIIPFLINHPFIDKITISEEVDKVSLRDEGYFKGFDIVFEPFSQVTDAFFYNKRHIIQEQFNMNLLRGFGYINPNEYYTLEDKERYPRFSQWFDVEKKDKWISIFPAAGYSKTDISSQLRSPSPEFWAGLVKLIQKLGYKVAQFGTKNSDLIEGVDEDGRNLSLFDAIKASIGMELMVSTDSGSCWLAGAYGIPQICLYTNYKNGHINNIDAFIPLNHQNNLKAIYGPGGISNINPEYVLESIKEVLSK